MGTSVARSIAAVLLFAAGCSPASRAQSSAAPRQAEAETEPHRIVLDRIVAVVGDQPILASEVDAEMRFAALDASSGSAPDDTPARALARLIDRMLIDRQLAVQPGAPVPEKEVRQAIADLQAGIPACAQIGCASDSRWRQFLSQHGFTQDEIEARVRKQIEIVHFIDMRFGMAARVSNAAVEKYYKEVLTPKLHQAHAAVPELSKVSLRIREILRQQQIGSMMDHWLENLRSEQPVHIVDTTYGTGEDIP